MTLLLQTYSDGGARGAAKGGLVKPAPEWLGDFRRLAWGLLYWNVRKSLFRIRGAGGAAPCQHPSDSGRAGQRPRQRAYELKEDPRQRVFETVAQGNG